MLVRGNMRQQAEIIMHLREFTFPSHGMDGCRVPATSRFGSTGAQAGEADTAAGERETKRRKTAMPTCDKSWSLTWIWFAEK